MNIIENNFQSQSHYSLFIVHYSLFIIHYSLFTVHYSLKKIPLVFQRRRLNKLEILY
jgi:hypothetical protein